ncbi:hypothetical protein QWI17_00325 [Gilvimarinus sp. SDUM040013]|uniref:Uncharacterized protein n=1 Tax=Gilvimarinus gilvus TaxID=3058038 RepID=A0ABU4S599_9GAMM|nr:hypothetical protein [Gilvimarinus sp. SDUM040013]MDO3384279.1 hypothetical protein [Gilvimarinus sp. SDUM040013]MDX6851576.1 hypothetical protein [Gilvimarinus sp. SDUM040013]
MKFIADTEIPIDPYDYLGLLRSQGILAKRNSEFQKAPLAGLSREGIWVILNSQYTDALALISDKSHIVANPLTEGEMVELEIEAKSMLLNASGSFFSRLAKFVFYFSILLFVVYAGYQIVKHT